MKYFNSAFRSALHLGLLSGGLLLASTLFAVDACAELLTYVDSNGRQHFVDDLKKVPEEYRDQLKDSPEIPEISKVKPGRRKLYEKKHYPQEEAKSLEVFAADWCGQCRALEATLKKERIAYKRLDIEKSKAAKREFERIGGKGIPLSRINGEDLISGNNIIAIKKALAKKAPKAAKAKTKS